MKNTKKRRDKGNNTAKFKTENTEGAVFPPHLKKDTCVYMDGVVESGAHGHWKIKLDNGMNALATARKLENIRINLLPGDKVTVEIPALGLNPKEVIRGRIVWRYRL